MDGCERKRGTREREREREREPASQQDRQTERQYITETTPNQYIGVAYSHMTLNLETAREHVRWSLYCKVQVVGFG